jgi:hypothetical protein
MSDSKASARRERLKQRRVYVHFNHPKRKPGSTPVADAVASNPDNQPHTMVFVCDNLSATGPFFPRPSFHLGSADWRLCVCHSVDDMCDAFVAEYHAAFPRHTVPFHSHGVVTTTYVPLRYVSSRPLLSRVAVLCALHAGREV